jgi:hypothetical protein
MCLEDTSGNLIVGRSYTFVKKYIDRRAQTMSQVIDELSRGYHILETDESPFWSEYLQFLW